MYRFVIIIIDIIVISSSLSRYYNIVQCTNNTRTQYLYKYYLGKGLKQFNKKLLVIFKITCSFDDIKDYNSTT